MAFYKRYGLVEGISTKKATMEEIDFYIDIKTKRMTLVSWKNIRGGMLHEKNINLCIIDIFDRLSQ